MTCSCRTARSRRSAAWRPTTRRWVASRMKLVGGDSGRAEHEHFVEDVVLAPSERAVVDVLFEQPGEFVLEHRTPEKTYRLGTVTVAEDHAEPPLTEEFEFVRRDPELGAERERGVSGTQAVRHPEVLAQARALAGGSARRVLARPPRSHTHALAADAAGHVPAPGTGAIGHLSRRASCA